MLMVSSRRKIYIAAVYKFDGGYCLQFACELVLQLK